MNPTHGPPPTLIHALRRAMAEYPSGEILWVEPPQGVGGPCPALAEAGPFHRRISATALLDPPPTGWRRPALCVACADLGLEGRDAEHALARLRDLYCERVLLFTPTASGTPRGWSPATLRALGFVRLFQTPGEAGWGLYGFDLYDYKATPDWLNPRYWANPELWDRYRW